MKKILMTFVLIASMGFSLVAFAEHPGMKDAETPSADEQVKGLEQMCEENAEARTARHAEKTLYERLGKEEGINRLTDELVRIHLQNDKIKHLFDGLDPDQVSKRVADFMISGMGGPAVYKNRPTLPDSHRHMKLTNADFMAAGADMIQTMKNLEYGQNEIDEVVCALVALRPMVVLTDEVQAVSHH